MAAEYNLYAKVDKHNEEVIEFMGTMSELCEYMQTLLSKLLDDIMTTFDSEINK